MGQPEDGFATRSGRILSHFVPESADLYPFLTAFRTRTFKQGSGPPSQIGSPRCGFRTGDEP